MKGKQKAFELEPGLYKVIKSGSSRAHLLHVHGFGAHRRHRYNGDAKGFNPWDEPSMDDIKSIQKYDVNSVEVVSAQITIEFTDEQGDRFVFTVGDAWALKNVFDTMPFLGKAFK